MDALISYSRIIFSPCGINVLTELEMTTNVLHDSGKARNVKHCKCA